MFLYLLAESKDLEGETKEMKITCSKKNGEAVQSAEYYREPWEDLPDEPDLKEVDEVVEYIQIPLDLDIIIDEDGSWEYEDDTYEWAKSASSDGDWYCEEYSDVRLDDYMGVVERIDDLLADLLPEKPGRYHLSGEVSLYYSITGIEYEEDFQGHDEDGDPIVDREVYTDNADVLYVQEESYIEDMECVPVDVSASTKVCAGVKFDVPEASSSQRYGMYVSAEYNKTQFSIYYNEIDTSPEADPLDMYNDFKAQVSEHHPYDEGRYLFARLEKGVIYFAENGKAPVKKSHYDDADTMGVENTDWCDEVIEQAIRELRELNSHVQSRMSHN